MDTSIFPLFQKESSIASEVHLIISYSYVIGSGGVHRVRHDGAVEGLLAYFSAFKTFSNYARLLSALLHFRFAERHRAGEERGGEYVLTYVEISLIYVLIYNRFR